MAKEEAKHTAREAMAKMAQAFMEAKGCGRAEGMLCLASPAVTVDADRTMAMMRMRRRSRRKKGQGPGGRS